MSKRILIYAALVAILTVVGIAVSLAIFGEEAAVVLPAIETDRRIAPPEAQKTDASPVSDAIEVVEVNGLARRLAMGGDWNVLEKGETLETDDFVKTTADAKVVLGVGRKSKIELAGNAEIKLGSVSDKGHRFKLMHGRVFVEYKEGGHRKLRIENKDGSAVAETEEGIFTVLNTGKTIAVATRTGSVDLSAGGQRVRVAAGTQSMVADGVPSRPTAIPADVMLRVVNPGCRVQRQPFIVINGRTSPGSMVSANGVLGTVRVNGRFRINVPLKQGRNTIVLVTEDPAGHRKEKTFSCVTVDSRAPIKKVDIKWGS